MRWRKEEGGRGGGIVQVVLEIVPRRVVVVLGLVLVSTDLLHHQSATISDTKRVASGMCSCGFTAPKKGQLSGRTRGLRRPSIGDISRREYIAHRRSAHAMDVPKSISSLSPLFIIK